MAPAKKPARPGKARMVRRPRTRSVSQTQDDENDDLSDHESPGKLVAMLSPAPLTRGVEDNAEGDAHTTGTPATGTVDTASATRTPQTAAEMARQDNSVAATPMDSTTMTAMMTTLQQLTMLVAGMQSTASHPGGDDHGHRRGGSRVETASRSVGGMAPSARTTRNRRRLEHQRRAAASPPSDPSSSSESSSSDDADADARSDQRRQPTGRGNGGDPSSESSNSGASSDRSSNSEDSRAPRRRGDRRRRQQHRHESRPRKKSVKDLELPTFTPSPKISVSTWIDRVDLALKGAKESGRGRWSDKSLYFILGNKLMENAAKWWVDMDRRLPERKRTWSNLKKALLRRYGEKLDKSTAEWRVSMRRMMPGETYADFAAGLRDVVGRNRVRERVLLAQFYRCLDKTTRKLVKQAPKPTTLEEAMEKATEIDDPMDNVAQGMINIGQAWATAPSRYVIPMDGTMGQTNVIPGITSGFGVATIMPGGAESTTAAPTEVQTIALFTNPQGIYNKYSGTWEPPPGHLWNGKYWYEPRKAERRRTQPAETTAGAGSSKPLTSKIKRTREIQVASESEPEASPRPKKAKAAVKLTKADDHPKQNGRIVRGEGERGCKPAVAEPSNCFKCGQDGHWAATCPTKPKCYACGQLGHMARDCTDVEAKARNDEYLRTRLPKSPTAEN
ncbi:hypothetical protein PR002_g23481 [Phytophthora rubi]|uniref:CCHC-type domain-containing protein n=1 Tax=Phytophthora rubi TaxID=129364 RepID=A0A6A3IKK0_9STRA|nr:hypothetical protein PR002_g23481 [Phytophthora rubi]